MKLSTQNHMFQLTKKLNCFGCFDTSYLLMQSDGACQLLSSLDFRPAHLGVFVLSERFCHFLSMINEGETKFYSEKTSLFSNSPFDKEMHYVALVKKTPTKKIKIYLFHAEKRMDVVHLLLHKDVMKRMALFIDENIAIRKPFAYSPQCSDLFNASYGPLDNLHSKSGYLQEVFNSLLTKKERDVVDSFLCYQSVNKVAERVNFSHSYVRQLLLSAAHKLGLSKVNDILSLDKTNGVLLRSGEAYGKRCC